MNRLPSAWRQLESVDELLRLGILRGEADKVVRFLLGKAQAKAEAA